MTAAGSDKARAEVLSLIGCCEEIHSDLKPALQTKLNDEHINVSCFLSLILWIDS